MRRLLILFIIAISAVTFLSTKSQAIRQSDEQSIIIEVDGDPKKHQAYLEVYHPSIHVIRTYDLLFNGLALQAPPKKLAKISSLPFVKALHPVHMYEVNDQLTFTHSPLKNIKKQNSPVLPVELNTTSFTGKGIKVGVIDTGIDYTHPDLATNYVGGYDLVDFDDDPMETMDGAVEGPPTIHGTHVAGIIAANGELQGVAPGASIYAYRALGPGGSGSSIQVIAALEQAVKDKVDVVNMSLGNSINGPDYPTSVAVNKAVDLGVAVVIANGNDGPGDWTVGSPATATKALSVGATSNAQKTPFLYERMEDKMIPLNLMVGSLPWELNKAYSIINFANQPTNSRGKIALIERGETPFYEVAKLAEEAGATAVIIANNEEDDLRGSIENGESPLTIPVVAISKKDGQFLTDKIKEKSLYIETIYKQTSTTIAPFSSRGPVTINWDIKPEILAPGTNIMSTIPGEGYLALNGTSMAAPHVAGAIAVMKEAHKDWTNEQIIGALKTTAAQLQNEQGEPLDPTIQGMGQIQLERAIQAKTIIDHPLLAFGKIDGNKENKQMEINVKNNSNEEQTYSFNIPKKQAGISWKLPKTFTLEKNEQKTIPIELAITTSLLKEGTYQGWLTLNEHEETYDLPYMFINKTADYPKAMGFDFSLKDFEEDTYAYHLYVTEKVRNLSVHLYSPDTLVYERTLLQLDDVKIGLNEGYVNRTQKDKAGNYMAIITVQLEDGQYDSYETDIYIE